MSFAARRTGLSALRAAAPRAPAASPSSLATAGLRRCYASEAPLSGPCFALSEEQEAYRGALTSLLHVWSRQTANENDVLALLST